MAVHSATRTRLRTTVHRSPLAHALHCGPHGLAAALHDVPMAPANPMAVAQQLKSVVGTLTGHLAAAGATVEALRNAYADIPDEPRLRDLHAVAAELARVPPEVYRVAFAQVQSAMHMVVPDDAREDLATVTDFAEARARLRALAEGANAFAVRYTRGKVLGSGGQVTTFLVTDRQDGRTYVARQTNNVTEYGRLAVEAAALQDLPPHPHVVALHDIHIVREDLWDSDSFLEVTTRAPGMAASEYLDNGIRLSPQQLEQVETQLRSALDHIHTHGVIHRDITPGNVMIEIRPDNSVHTTLIDFGLARQSNRATHASSAGKGTLLWMSPEQLYGRSVSGATDYHGMGLLLLALAHGEYPAESVLSRRIGTELSALRRVKPLPGTRVMPRQFLHRVARYLDPKPERRGAQPLPPPPERIIDPATPEEMHPKLAALIPTRATTLTRPQQLAAVCFLGMDAVGSGVVIRDLLSGTAALVVGGVVAALIGAVTWFKHRRAKKLERLIPECRALLMQMHQSIVAAGIDPSTPATPEAAEFVARIDFARRLVQVVRSLLRRDNDIVPLDKYVRHVHSNIHKAMRRERERVSARDTSVGPASWDVQLVKLIHPQPIRDFESIRLDQHLEMMRQLLGMVREYIAQSTPPPPAPLPDEPLLVESPAAAAIADVNAGHDAVHDDLQTS